MMDLNLQRNETARLKALDEYKILDTEPEQAYDGITHLAASICNTPIAGVSFIDRNREWFKSKIGIRFNEIPRGISLSSRTITDRTPLIVSDASHDKLFSTNPIVTGEPFVRFYTGVPLVVQNGFVLGTLHVMDRKPRKLVELQTETLYSLAQQVVELLELRHRLSLLQRYSLEHQRYERQFGGDKCQVGIINNHG